MKKILIIEDDPHINNMLCALLTAENYHPTPAYTGADALRRLTEAAFSLVLLDLMLPDIPGETVLHEIRTKHNIPTIVVTAKTDKANTVKLLRLGAEDYLTKPFNNNELLARIDVQLRRRAADLQDDEPIYYKNIKLEAYDAFIGNNTVGLSKREYEILRLLISHPKKVFTKNNLYESVWGANFMGDDNTINVHISHIRAKLNMHQPGAEYIQTIRGVGYKIN